MTLQEYVEGGYWLVPGWMYEADVRLFVLLNEVQRDCGIEGDLLDVGAYKGRASVLLGYMRGDNEMLTVCDLFGTPTTNEYSAWENVTYYPDLELQDFRNNYLRYHPEMPVVIRGPSTELAGRCAARTFRFIHVDASHIYPDVRADLLVSKELALPRGSVVAIDDICSPHTPGVWAAAWETVFSDSLVPLVVSESKLYCSWGDGGDELLTRLLERLDGNSSFRIEHHPIRNREILRVALAQVTPKGKRSRMVRWVPPVVVDGVRRVRGRLQAARRPASS